MSKSSITAWIILLVVVLATAFFWVNRPRRVTIDAALPADFPETTFSHDSFEELLQTYVTADGRVDYELWQRSSLSTAQLNAYLAAVSRYSPDNAPDRFQSRNDTLAYWMYGYNAYVIKSVLNHWPIKSVTDVKAPIEAVKGLGLGCPSPMARSGPPWVTPARSGLMVPVARRHGTLRAFTRPLAPQDCIAYVPSGPA